MFFSSSVGPISFNKFLHSFCRLLVTLFTLLLQWINRQLGLGCSAALQKLSFLAVSCHHELEFRFLLNILIVCQTVTVFQVNLLTLIPPYRLSISKVL